MSLQPLTTGRASSDPLPAPVCAQVPPTVQTNAAPRQESVGPITSSEVESLIRALEPMPLKEGRGRATRAAVERGELPPDRLRVLLADVTSLLGELHARENLTALKGAPRLSSERRAAVERALNVIRTCARLRFAERGGDGAFNASLEIVERHRRALEALLLRGDDGGAR